MVTPSEFREDLDIHKTRMNGLSRGEESFTIYSAVLIQCQRVPDGQTDGRTDVQPISITCFSIADARKNGKTISNSQSLSAIQFSLMETVEDGPVDREQHKTEKGCQSVEYSSV